MKSEVNGTRIVFRTRAWILRGWTSAMIKLDTFSVGWRSGLFVGRVIELICHSWRNVLMLFALLLCIFYPQRTLFAFHNLPICFVPAPNFTRSWTATTTRIFCHPLCWITSLKEFYNPFHSLVISLLLWSCFFTTCQVQRLVKVCKNSRTADWPAFFFIYCWIGNCEVIPSFIPYYCVIPCFFWPGDSRLCLALVGAVDHVWVSPRCFRCSLGSREFAWEFVDCVWIFWLRLEINTSSGNPSAL